jgi:hypothetical protein
MKIKLFLVMMNVKKDVALGALVDSVKRSLVMNAMIILGLAWKITLNLVLMGII